MPQSWNRYAYVQNDPINRFDPFGLFGCDPNVTCVEVTDTFVPVVPADVPGFDPLGPEPSQFGRGQVDTPYCNATDDPLYGTPGYDGGYGGESCTSPNVAVSVDSCTVDMFIYMECEEAVNSSNSAASLFTAAGKRFALAYLSWHSLARFVGSEGERVVRGFTGLARNNAFITGTNSGVPRKPDMWDVGVAIHEVKNVSNLTWTTQLDDMASWAFNNGNQQFVLWVNRSATIQPSVHAARATYGNLVINYFSWP